MKDFQLTFNSLPELVRALTELVKNNHVKKWRISIKEWREKRSISQNSLYWLWMGELEKTADVMGVKYKSDAWAEVFKDAYCPSKSIETPFGIKETKSTTKLDTGEMHYYLNQIHAYCMQYGWVLPVPEDSEYNKLINEQEL